MGDVGYDVTTNLERNPIVVWNNVTLSGIFGGSIRDQNGTGNVLLTGVMYYTIDILGLQHLQSASCVSDGILP